MLEFPIEFFDDEVIDGFYVPSIMKHCWAAQMEVVKVVDDICKKNDIKYYIFSGTLLGAIRHGGYIPWDDDVDICMMRRDYQKFIKVAKQYAPDRYYIRNMHTDPTYRDCFTRFCNDSQLAFNEEFWKKGHGFFSSAGIDVFPLDIIPKDVKRRDRMRDEARIYYSIAMNYDTEGLSQNVKDMIKEAEKRYGVHFELNELIPQQALIMFENVFRSVKGHEGDKVHIPMVWMDRVDCGIPVQAFENAIDVAFENTTFKAPYLYDVVLKKMFGQYMRSIRVCDIHNYPWYSPILQEVQKDIEIEKYYDYDASALPEANRREKWIEKTMVDLNEAVDVFAKASAVAEKAFSAGDVDSGNKLLEKCQELAQKAERLEKSLKGNGKQRVVFFSWKAKYWEKLDPFYRAEVAAGNEVFVIPVRFVRMTEDRKMSEPFMEMEGYPEDIVLTNYETFDYDEYRIDRIYTQNNYDDMNGAVRLADFFYTSNLQKYADELIYVPWYELDQYNEDDERAAYVMKYSVFMPGTVTCDRMIVSSQWFKDRCVSELTKWAGENTKSIWVNKIEVASWESKDRDEAIAPTDKIKRLFYYIGTGQLLASPQQVLNKMRANVDVFEMSKDKINVKLYIENGMRTNLAKYNSKYITEFDDICNEYGNKDWCEIVVANKPIDVNDYQMMRGLVDSADAFYGDAGVILHVFERANKPVMQQNTQIY